MHVRTPARLGRPLAVLTLLAAFAACAPPADDEADDPAGETSESATPTPTPSDPAPTDPATTDAAPPPTKAPEPAGLVIDVAVNGDKVSPNATELELEVGEPLLLRFDADRGGELHVHSKPEQYVDFTDGRSEQEITIETPGTVEIEEHDSGAVIAVVEVR